MQTDMKQTLLSIMKEISPVQFISDLEFDSSGSIIDYQMVFATLHELVDTIFNNFHCPCRNMDKNLLIKLKINWDKAINRVENFSISRSLSIIDWFPAMWLFSIGCPTIVHTQDEMITLVCETVLNNKSKSEIDIEASLLQVKFRPSFAKWLSYRITNHLDSFEHDLWDISEPISLCSFLFTDNSNIVKYNSSQPINHEDNTKVSSQSFQSSQLYQSSQLSLKVIPRNNFDNSTSVSEITAVPFTNLNRSWVPMDFAKFVFEYIQHQFKIVDNTYVFYGHCTSEESIMKMNKFGMSPFYGYKNKTSCGHGMYFFQMGHMNFSFEELFMNIEKYNNEINVKRDMKNDVEKAMEKDMSQFCSFIYAIFKIFDRKSIRFLSPAILLFKILKTDINSIDSTKTKLTLRQNCLCSQIITNDNEKDLSCQDIVRIFQMIPDNNDIQKYNMFALLSGIADMEKIAESFGIICSSSSDCILNIPEMSSLIWDDQSLLNQWKCHMKKPIQRTVLHVSYFDENNHRNEIKKKVENIDFKEFIFISITALEHLLQKGNPSVCFVNVNIPFHLFNNIHFKFYYDDEEMTENNVLKKTKDDSKKSHNYWKLKLRCIMNHKSSNK